MTIAVQQTDAVAILLNASTSLGAIDERRLVSGVAIFADLVISASLQFGEKTGKKQVDEKTFSTVKLAPRDRWLILHLPSVSTPENVRPYYITLQI